MKKRLIVKMKKTPRKILCWAGIIFLLIVFLATIQQTLLVAGEMRNQTADTPELLGSLTGIVIVFWLCIWGIKKLWKKK